MSVTVSQLEPSRCEEEITCEELKLGNQENFLMGQGKLMLLQMQLNLNREGISKYSSVPRWADKKSEN